MKSRKRLFGLFVVVAAVAVWFVFIRDSAEPRIAGRPVTFLLDEMNAGESRSNAAVAIIAQAGAGAVPALTNQLRYESSMRTNFIALKTRLPWVIASRLPRAPQINYLRRYSAIYALEKLGPDAKAAIPALVETITTGDTAELMMPGNNGGMLIGRSWAHDLRASAMNVAAKIDHNDHEVLKTAAALVAAADRARGPAVANMAATRAAGLRALEAADDPSERTIENILRIFRAQERDGYWQTLGSFQSPAVSNVRGTMRGAFSEANAVFALQSTNVRHREAATFELGDPRREPWRPTGRISDTTVTALIKALEDPEERVRFNAADTLARDGRATDEAARVCMEFLDHSDSLIRLRAIEALRRIEKINAAAKVKLEAAAKDKIGLIRVWARKTLDESAP